MIQAEFDFDSDTAAEPNTPKIAFNDAGANKKFARNELIRYDTSDYP
jgi:hypothetical protein